MPVLNGYRQCPQNSENATANKKPSKISVEGTTPSDFPPLMTWKQQREFKIKSDLIFFCSYSSVEPYKFYSLL